MKKLSRILAALLALSMILALLPAVFAADEPFVFEVLSTTDMHGRATTRDVSTQKEDNNSMERVATIVKTERETYGKNMLVLDCGDLIQGTLVAQYAINQKPDKLNPMIEALAEIGYDVYTMGNHEFNFTPAQRDKQVQFANEKGINVLAANIVLKTDGKNYKGEDVKAGEPYYEPYYIKEIDAGNGRTVRVAVIGLGNAANETWDLATNYPNLQFTSLDNPEGLLENEINKWVKIVREQEKADIVIVSAHSGAGSETVFSLESQVLYAVGKTHGVDLIVNGHDHRAAIREDRKDADGKIVPIVNGGGSTVTRSLFSVTFDENNKVSGVSIDSSALALKDVKGDAALAEKLEPWFAETYAWASKPLGSFDKGWTEVQEQAAGKTNNDMVLAQTELMNFVHKAQIWASWLSYESEKIEGATVSLASPVFGTAAGGKLSFVPKDGDTVSMLELSKLYRYANNLLCAVDMTGEQLYKWMSHVADMYEIREDGSIGLAKSIGDEQVSIYGVDTFYGVDYTLDISRPRGERVVFAKIQGQDLKTYGKKIRVTLNSYRLSGGYGFAEATGLSEADCCWTANQYLGADRAPVPTMLGEYVAAMKTVSPSDKVSHGYDSSWKIVSKYVFENPFVDVKEDAWYYDYVLEMAEKGIIKGMTGVTFVPEGKLTRAQMAMMLYRVAGEPEVKEASTFTDVEKDAWYADAIAWAQDEGVVKGMTETTFEPESTITREQMVTMFYRMENTPETKGDLTKFEDEKTVSEYAVEAFQWAVEQEIINGTKFDSSEKVYLDPQGVTTRAQAAKVFSVWMGLE